MESVASMDEYLKFCSKSGCDAHRYSAHTRHYVTMMRKPYLPVQNMRLWNAWFFQVTDFRTIWKEFRMRLFPLLSVWQKMVGILPLNAFMNSSMLQLYSSSIFDSIFAMRTRFEKSEEFSNQYVPYCEERMYAVYIRTTTSIFSISEITSLRR